MSLRHRVEATACRALLAATRVVPRRMLIGAGGMLGRLAGLLNRRHTQIARTNVADALGLDATGPENRRLVSECWAHFGRIMFDTMAFPRLGPDSVGEVVEIRGLEHIRAAYERGNGVLLFSGHFGHWELTALMQGHLGLPLALVTRPLDNPALERVLAELRGGSGNRIVHKRSAVREMLRALKQRIGVAIVIDQDARDTGVFVPFFGRPASTSPTLALLALRSGAAVIPTYSIPRPGGKYLIVYEPEIEIRQTGDRAADVLRITAECTARIERWVREHPELWLWMHRRWKTPPPPDGDVAAIRPEGQVGYHAAVDGGPTASGEHDR